MLGVFAEFETNLRHERQLEGIAKAKAAGVYKWRPASIDRDAIEKLKGEGLGPAVIARQLKIGRASVFASRYVEVSVTMELNIEEMTLITSTPIEQKYLN
jgi:hypothetical protein